MFTGWFSETEHFDYFLIIKNTKKEILKEKVIEDGEYRTVV